MKLFVSALAVASIASAAQAAPQVLSAWSRPAAAGGTGAGFMILVNPDARPDALVAVETPLARDTQIHQSKMSGGVASMQRLDRVALSPRGRVTFAPGGYHLMFMGLARSLKVGDAVPATLVFESGARVKASFVVGFGPPAADHAGH